MLIGFRITGSHISSLSSSSNIACSNENRCNTSIQHRYCLSTSAGPSTSQRNDATIAYTSQQSAPNAPETPSKCFRQTQQTQHDQFVRIYSQYIIFIYILARRFERYIRNIHKTNNIDTVTRWFYAYISATVTRCNQNWRHRSFVCYCDQSSYHITVYLSLSFQLSRERCYA